MSAVINDTSGGNFGPPLSPAMREQNAQKGIRHSSQLVAEHVAGQRRADLFIASLLHSSVRGDELLAIVTDLAERMRTHEGRAHARGFCRGLQKRLEATAL